MLLFGLWPKLTEPTGFFQQLALLLPLVAFKPGNFDMMIFVPNLQLFLKGCTLSVLKSWQPASDFCEEGCFASLKENFQILGSQSYRVESSSCFPRCSCHIGAMLFSIGGHQ